MVVKDIIEYFENWAPLGAAWENDNIGLQVGLSDRKVKNIFICLELNEQALDQALSKKCNFIFTHHPLIFEPISKIVPEKNTKAMLIERLLKNNIALYSAHTNFDFTKGGVSFELAKKLKLQDVEFLENQKNNQFKLVVFIPDKHLDKVSEAIFDAGGGVIGEYTNCSYKLYGEGTFKGSSASSPAIGKKENLEKVEEVRLEVIINNWNLNKVIKALIKAHPYEEPAYDIYPLKNKNVNYGFGAIGFLKNAMSTQKFLSHVCSSLKTKTVRHCKSSKNQIRKVAVCGGSGSRLLNSAISQNADAFITADIKYHDFQDAEDKILFVDAGHYETEIPALDIVKRRLEKLVTEKKESIKVYNYSRSTNPVRIFNN
jgi:dinuclear metal center YbgI/SA1388 family protein